MKHRKRRLFHRRKRGGNTACIESFPLRPRLLQYAVNLFGRMDMNENFVDFIFSLLGPDARKELIEYLHSKDDNPRHEVSQVLREAEYRPRNRSRMLQDLIEKNTSLRHRELGDFIYRLCMREERSCRTSSCSALDSQINELAGVFGFSEDEIEIIRLIYCYNDCEDFEDFLRNYRSSTLHHVIAGATGLHIRTVKKALGSSGRVLKSGVVEECRRPGDTPWLNQDIFEFLSGVNDSSLIEQYCRIDTGTRLPLGSFSVSSESIDIISALLESPSACNILIYGRAGTGKTEFARSMISACSKDCCFLQYGDTGSNSARHTALNTAIHSVAQKDNAVLVIDEADSFLNFPLIERHLNSERLDKGWFNNLFDNLDVKLIWITNHIGKIEESTLRRFSFSLHFKKQTVTQRQEVWKNLLRKNRMKSLFSDSLIQKLSRRYEVNAAGIASTIETVRRLSGAKKRKDIEPMVSKLLSRHEKLISGDSQKPAITDLTPRYDPDVLNIDADRNAILDSLHSYVRFRDSHSADTCCNINFLFWGLPGTGKTEFAKYIASELNMLLMVRRASDLESMWLGQTEKNIRDAFEEAQKDNAILFVDEADSFFTDRTSAHRSWEVSRTNEFLTQMENHTGILICCTNLLDTLDKASIRRFDWKVEFKPLTDEGKLKIYRKYFRLPGTRITSKLKDRIRDIPGITAGDIKTVWHKNRFIPPQELTHEHIIRQIEKEAQYKGDLKQQIGF